MEEQMKKFKKALSLLLAGTMALSLTACAQNEEGGTSTNANANTNSGAENTAAPDQSYSEAEVNPIDETAPTGNIVVLTYDTSWESSKEELITKFEKETGGTFTYRLSGSGDEYFQALGTFIASGDSPDIVTYEWRSFPHAMSYNVYTPLDSYIDIDGDLWKGMKPIAEQFVYNGKHYYFPNEITTNYCLNYNNRVLQANNMPDPMELLEKNEWTWSAFESMLDQWCLMDDNHIGFNGASGCGMSFCTTTGEKFIDIQGSEIINNARSASISRCMSWLEDMRKNGLLGVSEAQAAATGHNNGYEPPDQAFVDGNLLFLAMEPFWAYNSAKEKFWNLGQEEEIKFVPFPRDDNSDTYYHTINTAGFMVPAGASNVKGAVDWINFAHREITDPANIAKAKDTAIADIPAYKTKCQNSDCGDTSENADNKGRHVYTDEENENNVTVCPVCGTQREQKFKLVWSEEQYDLYKELCDPSGRFELLYDHCFGFSSDVSDLYTGDDESLQDGVVFHDQSYTTLIETKYNVIEGYLQEYRDIMKKNAGGETVTMDWSATAAPETEAQ